MTDLATVIVPALSGSLADMKRMRERCVEAGIDAEVGCPPGSGKGWGTKTHLLVEEADLPRLAALLQRDWDDSLEREGNAPVRATAAATDGDEPPCPACGCALPLLAGACSDCGIQLE